MADKTPSYQQLRAELDSIVQKLQDGELDVDEAVVAYEQGIDLLKKLEKYLESAENKITKLKASFDNQTGAS